MHSMMGHVTHGAKVQCVLCCSTAVKSHPQPAPAPPLICRHDMRHKQLHQKMLICNHSGAFYTQAADLIACFCPLLLSYLPLLSHNLGLFDMTAMISTPGPQLQLHHNIAGTAAEPWLVLCLQQSDNTTMEAACGCNVHQSSSGAVRQLLHKVPCMLTDLLLGSTLQQRPAG